MNPRPIIGPKVKHAVRISGKHGSTLSVTAFKRRFAKGSKICVRVFFNKQQIEVPVTSLHPDYWRESLDLTAKYVLWWLRTVVASGGSPIEQIRSEAKDRWTQCPCCGATMTRKELIDVVLKNNKWEIQMINSVKTK